MKLPEIEVVEVPIRYAVKLYDEFRPKGEIFQYYDTKQEATECMRRFIRKKLAIERSLETVVMEKD